MQKCNLILISMSDQSPILKIQISVKFYFCLYSFTVFSNTSSWNERYKIYKVNNLNDSEAKQDKVPSMLELQELFSVLFTILGKYRHLAATCCKFPCRHSV